MSTVDTLTKAEAAYAHLASFREGQLVHVTERGLRFTASVITPQQHDHSDINRAYLVVASHGTGTRITVGSLLAGQHTITAA